jgi:hypothetical protein
MLEPIAMGWKADTGLLFKHIPAPSQWLEPAAPADGRGEGDTVECL